MEDPLVELVREVLGNALREMEVPSDHLAELVLTVASRLAKPLSDVERIVPVNLSFALVDGRGASNEVFEALVGATTGTEVGTYLVLISSNPDFFRQTFDGEPSTPNLAQSHSGWTGLGWDLRFTAYALMHKEIWSSEHDTDEEAIAVRSLVGHPDQQDRFTNAPPTQAHDAFSEQMRRRFSPVILSILERPGETGTSLENRVMVDPIAAWSAEAALHDIFWDEGTTAWYVLSAHAVRDLSRDPRLRARGVGAGLDMLSPDDRAVVEPLEIFFSKWLAFSDPPKQALIRRALVPTLTRGKLAPHFEQLGGYAEALWEEFEPEGEDLLDGVLVPLAQRTAAAVLGVDEQDIVRLRACGESLINYLASPGIPIPEAVVAANAVATLQTIVEELIERGNGNVAALLAARAERSNIDRLDIAATVAQLLTGALEPLATASAACALSFAKNGFSERTSSVLIEEALRVSTPFHFAPRVAREDFDYGGVNFAKGSRVVLNLLAANFGLDSADHLSFGFGTHYCLGATTSRTHLQTVMSALGRKGAFQRIDHRLANHVPAFSATRLSSVLLSRTSK